MLPSYSAQPALEDVPDDLGGTWIPRVVLNGDRLAPSQLWADRFVPNPSIGRPPASRVVPQHRAKRKPQRWRGAFGPLGHWGARGS